MHRLQVQMVFLSEKPKTAVPIRATIRGAVPHIQDESVVHLARVTRVQDHHKQDVYILDRIFCTRLGNKLSSATVQRLAEESSTMMGSIEVVLHRIRGNMTGQLVATPAEWLAHLKHACLPLHDALVEKCPRFAPAMAVPRHALLTLFPNDTAAICRASEETCLGALEAILEWPEKFLHKAPCIETLQSEHDLRVTRAVHPDALRALDPTLVLESHAASDLEAIRALKKALKAQGSTCFFAAPHSVSDRVTPECVNRLCELGALVVDDSFPGGTKLYFLARDHALQCQLVDLLANVVERGKGRARLSPPMPAAALALNDAQLLAVARVDLEPITILAAGPGMGKTKIIEVLTQRYQGRVAVQTFVGTMAVALQERGVAQAETLHRALHRRAKGTAEAYTKIRVLIWDEASNIDMRLAAQTLARFPRLERLVLVLDPEQIAPIGRGQLGMDLMRYFADHCSTLSVTMRVAAHTECQQITANDRAFMARTVDDMVWTEVDARSTMRLGPGVFHCDYANAADLRTLTRRIVQHWCPEARGRMFLTLTNKERHVINETVDEEVLANKNLQRHGLPPLFYSGQMIAIAGRNYPKKAIDSTIEAMYASASKKRGKRNKRKRRGEHVPSSDAVSNGEIFEVAHLTFYDTLVGAFLEDTERLTAWSAFVYPKTTASNRPSAKPILPVLVTRCGRKFVVADGFVPASAIERGWAFTSNKSQGREFETVIAVLPPDAEDVPSIFIRNHVHVMLSRPKVTLLILGSRTMLARLATRDQDDRNTQLDFYLDMRVRDALEQTWVSSEALHQHAAALREAAKNDPAAPSGGRKRSRRE